MRHVEQQQLGFRGVRALLGRVNMSVKAKLKAAPPETPTDAEALVKGWTQEAAAAADTQAKQARQSHIALSPLLFIADASAQARRSSGKRRHSFSSSVSPRPAAEPALEAMQEEEQEEEEAQASVSRFDPDLHGTAP